jgi:3-deoxy-D-manno-octulosonic acid hydroxylase-like protein
MKVVTIERWPEAQPRDYRSDLEAGNIVFLPRTPFAFPKESRDFLRSLEFGGGAIHKNIAYRTQSDKVTGIDAGAAEAKRLHDVMRSYSQNVVRFVSELLPQYAAQWKLDYASFRPVEEHGRDLPLNKRNDLIHTDAFPSRPTKGDLILRVFTNIHPEKKRVWITADPFRIVAEKYACDAGLTNIAESVDSTAGRLKNASARLLQSVGVPVVPRSAYDSFMLHFHEYLKRNTDFQANTRKYEFEFPPDSTWMCFTDVVPHSVKAGQHAVEQTFIISRASLADPSSAPLAILEQICGKPLAA